jgi:sugar phosphate isomerase/epimerase
MKLSFILPRALSTDPDPALAAWMVRAGFDLVDTEAEWSDAGIAAVQDAGVILGPLRVRASLADSDATSRKQAIDDACAALDRAQALGLSIVWTLTRNFRNDTSQRENFVRALETLPEVVHHAESVGVRIAIENCPFSGQNPVCTPEAWDALFAAIPSDHLGICFDPSHCIWQGIDIDRVIREYGHRFVHLHAKDTEVLANGLFRFGVEGPQIGNTEVEDGWTKHGWWRHRLPGLGAVDWNRMIGAVIDRGYDGAITIEHEDPIWSGSPDLIRRGLERSRTYLSTLIP